MNTHSKERIRLAIETLRRTHPVGYILRRDPNFWYWRCPTCDQWSPCDVRILCDTIDPKGTQTREQWITLKSTANGVSI